jgi:MinD-like ATPase involved in chromosome partitioning or flagellar assembly
VPLISLLSAKGSPGVTVTAAALVAAAHNPSAARTGGVLVELDPAGGDLEVLAGGRTGEPALLHAAADLRRGVSPDVLAAHAVELVPGVRGLLAPTAAHAAGSVVETLGGALGTELAHVSGWVVADAGRWDPHQAAAPRAGGSDLVAIVCRSTAPSVAHARDLVTPLRRALRPPVVAVVLVGDAPYGRAEVAEVFDVPVVGPLAWDPRSVSELWSTGTSARWLGRSLGRSARRVLTQLADLIDEPGDPDPAAPAQPSEPVPVYGPEVQVP